MEALEFIWGIIMALVPPGGAEADKIRKWRIAVALCLGGSILGTGLHVAWACGFLAFVGLPGFARADDLGSIRGKIAEVQTGMLQIQIGQLRTEILQTRTTQCEAVKSANSQALTVITREMQDALDRYQILTGRQYRLPDCNLL